MSYFSQVDSEFYICNNQSETDIDSVRHKGLPLCACRSAVVLKCFGKESFLEGTRIEHGVLAFPRFKAMRVLE